MASIDELSKLSEEKRDWNDLVDEFEAVSKEENDEKAELKKRTSNSLDENGKEEDHLKILEITVRKFNENGHYLGKNLRVAVLMDNLWRNISRNDESNNQSQLGSH